MNRSIATKTSEGKHQRGFRNSLLERDRPRCPQAEILALQHMAGNNAVNELLHPNQNKPPSVRPSVPPAVEDVLKNDGGQPLQPSTRELMESRFGQNFNEVRIHTGPHSAKSARMVNANAYAMGNHIVLRSQRTADSPGGQRLLAHELAHVVQQARGGTSTPLPLPGNSLDHAADRAAADVSKSDGPVHVAGASATGLARQPISTIASKDPRSFTNEELEYEIALVTQWLKGNPASSVERNRLQGVLQSLMIQAAQRNLEGLERRFGQEIFPFLPAPVKQQVHLANLSAGFGSGFMAGLQLALPPESPALQAILEADISKPSTSIPFNLGIQVGIPIGAGKGLWDNILGLFELAKLAFRFSPVGQTLAAFEELHAYVQDPERYRELKAQERDEYLHLIEGIWEFAKLLETDPAMLIKNGEALGYEAGVAAAEWQSSIIPMKPFDRGMAIGEVLGRIMIEVALLFLGPEEWAARGVLALGKAAKGRKIGKVVLEMLERIPELRKAIEARRLARGSAGKHAGEKAADVGSTAAKAEPVLQGEKVAGEGAGSAQEIASRTPEISKPLESSKAQSGEQIVSGAESPKQISPTAAKSSPVKGARKKIRRRKRNKGSSDITRSRPRQTERRKRAPHRTKRSAVQSVPEAAEELATGTGGPPVGITKPNAPPTVPGTREPIVATGSGTYTGGTSKTTLEQSTGVETSKTGFISRGSGARQEPFGKRPSRKIMVPTATPRPQAAKAKQSISKVPSRSSTKPTPTPKISKKPHEEGYSKEVERYYQEQSIEHWKSRRIRGKRGGMRESDTSFARHDQSFNSMVKTLKNKQKALAKQGLEHLLPEINEGVLKAPVDLFIETQGSAELRKLWQELKAKPELRDRLAKEWGVGPNAIGAREVGSRRPDITEFLLDRQKVEFTDITTDFADPIHQFKSQFYIEVFNSLLGKKGPKVVGLDINPEEHFSRRLHSSKLYE